MVIFCFSFYTFIYIVLVFRYRIKKIGANIEVKHSLDQRYDLYRHFVPIYTLIKRSQFSGEKSIFVQIKFCFAYYCREKFCSK